MIFEVRADPTKGFQFRLGSGLVHHAIPATQTRHQRGRALGAVLGVKRFFNREIGNITSPVIGGG